LTRESDCRLPQARALLCSEPVIRLALPYSPSLPCCCKSRRRDERARTIAVCGQTGIASKLVPWGHAAPPRIARQRDSRWNADFDRRCPGASGRHYHVGFEMIASDSDAGFVAHADCVGRSKLRRRSVKSRAPVRPGSAADGQHPRS
jgi:hypothetical protein